MTPDCRHFAVATAPPIEKVPVSRQNATVAPPSHGGSTGSNPVCATPQNPGRRAEFSRSGRGSGDLVRGEQQRATGSNGEQDCRRIAEISQTRTTAPVGGSAPALLPGHGLAIACDASWCHYEVRWSLRRGRRFRFEAIDVTVSPLAWILLPSPLRWFVDGDRVTVTGWEPWPVEVAPRDVPEELRVSAPEAQLALALEAA